MGLRLVFLAVLHSFHLHWLDNLYCTNHKHFVFLKQLPFRRLKRIQRSVGSVGRALVLESMVMGSGVGGSTAAPIPPF